MPRHRKKTKRNLPWRRIALYSAAGAGILTLAGVLGYFLIKSQSKPSHELGVVLNDYVGSLQKNGFLVAGEIRPKGGGDPFITILVPKGDGITDAQIHEYIELITFTADLFDKRQGFRDDDINLPFKRPRTQRIVFVDLPGGLPDPIGMLGEATINTADDTGNVLSVVNLSGNLKQLGRPYSNYWSTIQAVCLGHAIQSSPDADPLCNIFSANAAAGYAGIDPATAQAWINGLGSTHLAYLGATEYTYRYIDFVYLDFVRK